MIHGRRVSSRSMMAALPDLDEIDDIRVKALVPYDAECVLEWCFGPLAQRNCAHRFDLWYGTEKDEEIKRIFTQMLLTVGSSVELLESWSSTPRGAVAFVVLCAHLNRCINRGTPLEFQHDGVCLALTRSLLRDRRHADGSLTAPEAAALSVCLSQSEDPNDHRVNCDHVLPELMALHVHQTVPLQAMLQAALRLKEEIERFGRFQSRSVIPQHASLTPPEAACCVSNLPVA